MKHSVQISAALVAAISMTTAYSDAAPTDSITHLPLPNAASGVQSMNEPMAIPDAPICNSKGQMNFYSPRGKIDAAVAFFSANLKGFKHTHAIGSGRSQDTFYNSTGTLIVSITGNPISGAKGAEIYSITYGAIQPGVSEKVIISTNTQKQDCT